MLGVALEAEPEYDEEEDDGDGPLALTVSKESKDAVLTAIPDETVPLKLQVAVCTNFGLPCINTAGSSEGLLPSTVLHNDAVLPGPAQPPCQLVLLLPVGSRFSLLGTNFVLGGQLLRW